MVEGTTGREARTGTRIDFLDAIRGVASVMVVLQHSLEIWWPGFLRWSLTYVNFGRIGVVAFFVVSGYVVGLTLTKQSARTFTVRRFWRLYPAYWAAVLLYIAVTAPQGNFHLGDYGLLVLLLNVTMLQGVVGIPSVLGVAWTLGLEVAFYLQSVLAKLINRLPLSVWLGFGWLGLFALQPFINWLLHTHSLTIVPLMPFTASLGFALFLWDSGRIKTPLFAYLTTSLTLAPLLVVALYTRSEYATDDWHPLSATGSYVLGLGLFGAMYLMRRVRPPAILLWLGGISYGLYLVHESVALALKPAHLPGGLMIFICMAVAIAVGWAMHLFVEKPSIAYARRRTQSARAGT